MTSAVAAYGTTLKWNGTALAELRSISGPGISFDTIDATHYTSASQFKEFIAGFGDGGEVGIEGSFIAGDTAGQIAFITDAWAKTVREAIITYSTVTVTWTFNAMVTNFEMQEPMDGLIGFTATLKVSGVPTLGITQEDQLSGLTLTTATLFPSFDAAIYTYNAGTAGTSVTVTPTCAGADSIKVYADGVLVSSLASGGTSGAIAITVDANVKIEVKCVGTGKVDRTYTINLAKTS
jgi:predicted secreted protein